MNRSSSLRGRAARMMLEFAFTDVGQLHRPPFHYVTPRAQSASVLPG
jgi:hypothetical protein